MVESSSRFQNAYSGMDLKELLDVCLAGDVARLRSEFLPILTISDLKQTADVRLPQGMRPRTPLSAACCGGSADLVDLLLVAKADANHVENGATSLHIASQEGHDAVVKRLLVHKASVNQSDNDGVTALCVAARMGHAATVAQLIQGRATVDQGDIDGVTALHSASEAGMASVTAQLLEARGTLGQGTHAGCTALYFGAQKGQHEVVALLLENLAPIDDADSDGATALYVSCREA